MDAVLMLLVSLVQGVRTTLGMWLKIRPRDWHAQSGPSALPQAKSGIHLQESHHPHGVILALVPRISVGPSRGLSIDPLETAPSRMEADKVRVPGEGRGPVLRAAQTSTADVSSALPRVVMTPSMGEISATA